VAGVTIGQTACGRRKGHRAGEWRTWEMAAGHRRAENMGESRATAAAQRLNFPPGLTVEGGGGALAVEGNDAPPGVGGGRSTRLEAAREA
jgi:hypothetical protein